MFWHLYKYRLKVLFNEKMLFFWTGIFPIILGTLFYMVFSDITEKSENVSSINVVISTENSDAIVEEIVKSDNSFASFIDSMISEGYFDVDYADYATAKEMLADEKSDGMLLVEPTEKGVASSLVFSKSGMNQTILKYIINTYNQGMMVAEDTAMNAPDRLEAVLAEIYNNENINKNISVTVGDMDPYNQYYFALFAMTCMFGASFGMVNTAHSQADQSSVGMRRAASPTKKMAMVISEYFAAVTITEILFVVLLVYLTAVLGINLGNKYGLILFASVMASLLGVAIGYFFGVVVKGKQAFKDGVMMATILFLNFLAGLMMGNMKYIIEKSCPIVNRINPAAIISDCFYSICVYNDMNLYTRCIVSMGIWTVILAVCSISILRREKYANL
ncbi:MAG: ABC transporter permease [Lachnospiraceae bacterium]|nr:ABC transporter permease [Lachnospiraceae bacterium]